MLPNLNYGTLKCDWEWNTDTNDTTDTKWRLKIIFLNNGYSMIIHDIPLSHLLTSRHDKNMTNALGAREISWLQLRRLLVSYKRAADLMHLFIS